MVTGTGNGTRDHTGRRTEGVLTDRVIGTYLHGPILARNPALADHILGLVTGTGPGTRSSCPTRPRCGKPTPTHSPPAPGSADAPASPNTSRSTAKPAAPGNWKSDCANARRKGPGRKQIPVQGAVLPPLHRADLLHGRQHRCDLRALIANQDGVTGSPPG